MKRSKFFFPYEGSVWLQLKQMEYDKIQKHNKCHSPLQSWETLWFSSPLLVSCFLAGCRWSVLHSAPPCLSWRGLETTSGLCQDHSHLQLTPRAAVTSHCSHRLSKVINIRSAFSKYWSGLTLYTQWLLYSEFLPIQQYHTLWGNIPDVSFS